MVGDSIHVSLPAHQRHFMAGFSQESAKDAAHTTGTYD
jgi:hypothetical protein